ncbi:MAG: ABC transporter permease [Fimbriimonadaceae bacterium]
MARHGGHGERESGGLARWTGRLVRTPHFGLIAVILALGTFLTLMAGTREDRVTGEVVNNFLNPGTLVQIATDTSFFAVLAIGVAVVIISGGIDLSVGSTYALAGVGSALVLRAWNASGWHPASAAVALLGMCLGIGLAAGLANGAMVVGLRVHPFVITLGMMWVYRGIAFVTSKAESILIPPGVTEIVKSSLGLRADLYPIPFLVMIVATVAALLFLSRTVAGRNVYAVGGNAEASYVSGIRIPRVLIGVYALGGLAAGLSAFLGASYYGATNCIDATGYELYAIASAVVGGVSLSGGRGSAFGAVLGALLIVLIRQAILTLRLDRNYEWIIIGLAIVVAVFLERLSRGNR